tara:strand:- start:278 stop:517 length:240 start_codon:yes stop_codon:yes gene_type:complete
MVVQNANITLTPIINWKNQLGGQMTQHTKKLEQRKKEIEQEKLDKQIVQWEYQKGAGLHFRKITYASGRIETVEFGEKK